MQTIVLIGLHAAAGPLAQAGLKVVSAPGFVEAIKSYQSWRAANAGTPVPLLVLDGPATHANTAKWLAGVARGNPVAVVRLPGSSALTDVKGTRAVLDAPLPLEELVCAVGVTTPGHVLAGLVEATGEISLPVPEEDFTMFEDDVDDWDEEPTPPSAPPGDPVGHIPGTRVAAATPPRPAVPPAPRPPADDWDEEVSPPPAKPQWSIVTPHADDPRPAIRPAPTAAPVQPVQQEQEDLLPWDRPVATPAAHPRMHDQGQLCPVVIALSGSGGVGKSTITCALAEAAATRGGLHTIAIDANRGQGDLSTYLRLLRGAAPSIYDAARSGNPGDAITDLAAKPQVRPGASPLHFALLPAPPHELVDTDLVTPAVYARAIEHARRIADLVVIDTQIMEAADTSGLFEQVLVPLMRTGAWVVGISRISSASAKNLRDRMSGLDEAGVDRARRLVVVNGVEAADTQDVASLAGWFERAGTLIASAPSDSEIRALMNTGAVASDHPAMRPLVDAVLYRVTGLDAFAPQQAAPRRRGFLARWRGQG